MFSILAPQVEAQSSPSYVLNWPMFLHDPYHTGYSTSSAPDTNDILWTYQVPQTTAVHFTNPIVEDGFLYIGVYSPEPYSFMKLDANTGDLIWSKEIYRLKTPAIVEGRIYAGSDDHNVYALDVATGDIIWTYPTEDRIEGMAAPIVFENRVYIGSNDGNLYVLDADNGALIWKYPTLNPSPIFSSPAIANGIVYFGSGSPDNKVYAYDIATHSLVWTYEGSNEMYTPTVEDGRVYVGSDGGTLYALDAETGDYLWSFSTGKRCLYYAATAYGKVYFGTGSLSGNDPCKVYALDAITGEPIWYFQALDSVRSPPAVADGKVFIGSIIADKKFYALDAFTGNKIWDYQTGGTDFGPAVAYGRVYEASYDGKIYCFGKENEPPKITINCPTPYGIYPADSGKVYSFSVTDIDPNPIVTATVTDFNGDVIDTPTSGVSLLPSTSGLYTLTVTAVDQAGLSSTEEVLFVVYDPSAGFATGGGWIVPEPELGDYKATFGFVAKYHKGSTAPDGNLEFQYNYRDINLKSVNIEWLVISANKALFQGTATINGEGCYTFRVQVTDGDLTGDQPDHFSIKIWEGTNTETDPIHDYKGNLAGGNIRVHKE